MHRLQSLSKDLFDFFSSMDNQQKNDFALFITNKIGLLFDINDDIIEKAKATYKSGKENRKLEKHLLKISEKYDNDYFSNNDQNNNIAQKYFRYSRFLSSLHFLISKTENNYLDFIYEIFYSLENKEQFIQLLKSFGYTHTFEFNI